MDLQTLKMIEDELNWPADASVVRCSLLFVNPGVLMLRGVHWSCRVSEQAQPHDPTDTQSNA